MMIELASREMTLTEWVDELPTSHSAKREFAMLKVRIKELRAIAKQVNEGRLTEAEMSAHLYFGGTFRHKEEEKRE